MAEDPNVYIVPSPADVEGYVTLSRTQKGKLFKKHLLSRGTLYHDDVGPGGSIEIDDEFLNTIKRNFDAKVCDIVQVPLANAKNQHTEDPRDNIGEVIDVEVTDGKLYAYLDIRIEDAIPKMGSTYLGGSASVAMDYRDIRDGLYKGPTLLQSCVTNRPHLNSLEDYQEVMASLSADLKGKAVLLSTTATVEPPATEEQIQPTSIVEPPVAAVEPVVTKPTESESLGEVTTTSSDIKDEAVLPPATATVEHETVPETEVQEEKAMTLEELLAELKNEHAIDVSALQARVSELETTSTELETSTATLTQERDEAVKLSNDLTEALGASGVVTLSNGSELTPADVIGAVSELAQGHLTLSNQVKALATKDAQHEVGDLVDTGRIYPTQKDWLVDLKLSNPTAYASFLATLPDTPAVPIEKEVGVVTPEGDAHNRHIEEIARLTAPGGAAWKFTAEGRKAQR